MDYKRFCEALPRAKQKSDSAWCRYVLRPLSFPLAWWMHRAGISANGVSLMGLIMALVGCIMISIPHFLVACCGAILMNIVALLDCVDGNIARARKQGGANGEWIDAIVGYTAYMLLPIAVGVGVGLKEGGGALNGWPVLLGAVASAFNIFARLGHQKFESAQMKAGVPLEQISDRSERVSMAKRFSNEVGLCGLMMPFLVVAVVAHAEIVFLGFYAALFFAVAVATITRRILAVFRAARGAILR